jgi:hypothetical protein
VTYDPIAIARRSLTQAREYRPSTDADKRSKAHNIATLEAFIAQAEAKATANARATHPSGGPK